MATESTTTPSTLVEEWVERTRLSWLQVAIMVGLVLMLFLVGAAYLDGVVAGPFNAEFWQNGMLYPAIVAYTLLIQPILRRLRDGAWEGKTRGIKPGKKQCAKGCLTISILAGESRQLGFKEASSAYHTADGLLLTSLYRTR